MEYEFLTNQRVTTVEQSNTGGLIFSWFVAPAGTRFTYLEMWVPMPGSDSVPEHRIRVADGRIGYLGSALRPGSDYAEGTGQWASNPARIGKVTT